ncbi:MAG: acyltransferase [Candidatus Rokuibacteriota bacterium]|nr:MAG: acyltransferase [Candidatus Rokubacteria bacterium]
MARTLGATMATSDAAAGFPVRGDRIASLDGLRAISIGLVLFGHLLGTSSFFLSLEANKHLALGELGVRVFFVISGFLITNLLLTELAATGRIHIGRFYLRRTFRIFPPYYVFILALALAELPRWIELAPGDLVHTLTYTSNYHATRSWNVGHTWSLSVEEQFYLLWPALLVLLGGRRAVWVAALFVLAAPLIRLGLWELTVSAREGVGHRFETVADSIAVGCVLSGARAWLHRQPLYRRVLGSQWLLLAPVVVVLSGALAQHPRIDFFVGFTLRNVLVALCIDRWVTDPSDRVGRVLNSRPFVFVGLISYSIYLWQQLFLNRYTASLSTSFPVNITLAVVAALASYYLVERPSLRLRQRVERVLFPGRAQGAAAGRTAPERRTLHAEAERPAPAS